MSEASPLAVGGVLRDVATIMERAPGPLLGTALACALPDIGLEVFDSFVWHSEETGSVFDGLFFTRILVSMVFTAYVVGVATKVVVAEASGRPITAATARAGVLARVPALMWAALIYGMQAGLGMLLFIVPGIFWLLKLRLAMTVVVAEEASADRAFRRSGELTEGNRIRLLLTLVVSVLPLFALQLFLVAVDPTWPLAFTTSPVSFVVGVSTWIVSALVLLVSALVDAVVYVKLADVHASTSVDETVQVFA
jgi:hypothetical protein